jgi:phosphoribosylamine--glycine ligase
MRASSSASCCDDVGSVPVRTLVIGSGGREHALVSALARDGDVTEVHATPGNPGMTAATLHDIDPLDPGRVVGLAAKLGVDLVVVGPEGPLVLGVADAVRERGIACFGASRAAAQIEGSKAFAKQVMAAANVPTALAHVCETASELAAALDAFGPPYVVKDDGLAAGKGVIVTDDRAAAVNHAAGRDRILVEEYLDGPEVSLFAVTDGMSVIPMQPAQDFKRVGDGDTGPNTGGMGAYSPLPWAPGGLVEEVLDRVLQPTVDELRKRGIPFQGLLYAGLAVTSRGIRVVEFNARFGDPETQVLLARLRTPLGGLLHAAATGRLGENAGLTWRGGAAVTVVVAAKGYPESPRTGDFIEGLDTAAGIEGVDVVHAGTALDSAGRLISAGGRILGVTAVGADLEEARSRAYSGVAAIHIDGAHYRSDIALQPLAQSMLSS